MTPNNTEPNDDLALEARMRELTRDEEKSIQNSSNIEFDLVMKDPHSFGMPTFQEYCRNPERWKAAKDLLFQSIDNASSKSMVSKFLETVEYDIFGYRSKSLEEMERIAKNEGYEISDLEMAPQFEDVGSQKGKLVVYLRPKRPKILDGLGGTF